MKTLLIILPVVFIMLSVYFAMKRLSKTRSTKKAFAVNLVTFLVLIFLVVCFAVPVFASNGDAAEPPAATTQTDVPDATAAVTDNSKGLGLISAALVTGLAGIGGGIAIAAAAPAAIGATSEDPKVFGKALIFVALGEAIALYGVIISILILQKV